MVEGTKLRDIEAHLSRAPKGVGLNALPWSDLPLPADGATKVWPFSEGGGGGKVSLAGIPQGMQQLVEALPEEELLSTCMHHIKPRSSCSERGGPAKARAKWIEQGKWETVPVDKKAYFQKFCSVCRGKAGIGRV